MALCFVAFFEIVARNANEDHGNTYRASQEEQGENANISEIVTGARDFDPWEEGYAQWLMAFFAIVATGVSIVGVIWIRRTLEETHRTADAAVEANKTAREMGEAQVRAYLHCEGAEFTIGAGVVMIHLKLKNTGQSPCTRCHIVGQIVAPNLGDGPPLTYHGLRHVEGGPISGGATDDLMIFFDARQVPKDKIRELFDSKWYLSAECVLAWRDVFNREQTLKFFLIEDTSRWEDADSGARVRKGTMRAGNRASDIQQAAH